MSTAPNSSESIRPEARAIACTLASPSVDSMITW